MSVIWRPDDNEYSQVTTPNRRCSDIEQLHPLLREVVVGGVLPMAKAAGLRVEVFETWRSDPRQYDLFRKGASHLKTAGVHGKRIAVDVVFIDAAGRWTWRPEGGMDAWLELGQIGKDCGLFWGGDWRRLVDCPHFQLVPVSVQCNVLVEGLYPRELVKEPVQRAVIASVMPNARQLIINVLRDVYDAADDAKLSQNTMVLLNQFRNSQELKDVKYKPDDK